MSWGSKHVRACLASLAMLLALPAAAAGSMTVQGDGKILLASSTEYNFRIQGVMARLGPDGSLDTGFGVGGGLIDFRSGSPFGSIAIQPDGRMVAVTGSPQISGQGDGFVLWGFQPDGTPNLDLGENGVAAGPIAQQGWATSPSTILSRPDGGLVVGGHASQGSKSTFGSMAVAQLFNPDGSFRETVGRLYETSNPEVRNTSLADLLLQPDGSLIALGSSDKTFPKSILLGRFLPGSGAPYDASFAGGAGLTMVNPYSPFGPPTQANTVVAAGPGLVVAGTAQNRMLLVGFDGTGVLDPSFGEKGFATLPLEGSVFAEATAAARQPDGKVLIAGRTLDRCDAEPVRGCWSLVVGRVDPNGSVDAGFGTGGFSRLNLANGMKPGERLVPDDELRRLVDVAVAPDGKILVAETPKLVEGRVLKVARLNANGSLDPGFGSGGVATAAPCAGTADELRRIGCLSSAGASLRARRLRSRRPRLSLRVRASEALDPLRNIRVFLPPALKVRAGFAQRVKATGEDGGSLPATAHPRRIAVSRLGKVGTVSLTLPRGTLKRTKRIARGRKLAFRVEVWFQDGSKQTIVLKR